MSKKIIVFDCNTGKKYSATIDDTSTPISLISSMQKKQQIMKCNKDDETFGYSLFHGSTGRQIENNQILSCVCSENDTLNLTIDTNKANLFPLSLAYKAGIYSLAVVAYFLINLLLAELLNIRTGWLINLLIIIYIPRKIISSIEKNKYIQKSEQGELNKYFKPMAKSTVRTNSIVKNNATTNGNGIAVAQKDADLNNKENESKGLDENNEVNIIKPEYYFNNIVEFMLYCKEVKGSGKEVVWLKGDKYEKAFNDIYNAFERKKFGEVIYLGEKCFEINPVAISVRFEMCEAYLALGKLEGAEKVLNDMRRYMATDYDIAHFYRKWGYILCEKKKWKAAAACYKYSLKFENSSNALMELAYIEQQGHSSKINSEMVEDIIIDNNIPLIKAEDILSLEDLDRQSDEQEEINQEKEVQEEIKQEEETQEEIKRTEEKQEENKTAVEEKPDDKYTEDNEDIKNDIEVTGCITENSAKSVDNLEKQSTSSLPKAMFCRKCGAKLIEGSMFCNKCGTKI